MNVTEFAEQIVFGKTLEDKLLVPGKLTLGPKRSAPNVDSLVAPSRPVGLEMQHDPGRNVQPPSDDQLENLTARGQLLHFLANHELLATELMALVLLKFPDAPHAFRQGVLVTLQEEQEHTRMYIRRMKECGVEFGRYPLSGQFWRIIEPMQSPMDFVSRLSLTFEQANLDYSLHFANVFQNLGDTETADVLQQIYEDEIGHVKHGLHWFRQWKDPEHSDWQAYQASLDFPMSPQRGRGPRGSFNRDGRTAAGLTEDFIDSIEVFRQSRGRAPTVRWFDPGAEAELSGELLKSAPDSRVNVMLDQLGKDLELVMLAMARQDDVMLVRQTPSREFCKQLIDAGFDLPELVRFEERGGLADRKLRGFSPWAWTPENHRLIETLAASAHQPPQIWNENWKDLYRKSWGASRFSEWLSQPDDQVPDWFVDESTAGTTICSEDDVAGVLAKLAEQGVENAIFKKDLAASGRTQRRLPCQTALNEQDQNWLKSIFESAESGSPESKSAESKEYAKNESLPVAILEPELNRAIDLSFLWEWRSGEKEARFLGWTRPIVTAGRRYCGTRLGARFSDCDSDVKQFVLADRAARLHEVQQWLQPRIERELASRDFVGHFGVDVFVCRNASGDLKIKPLVELNPRVTMGHIALELEKKIAPGVVAEFRVLSNKEWASMRSVLSDATLEKSPDGRWKSGVVYLCEPNASSKYVPLVLVGKELVACQS